MKWVRLEQQKRLWFGLLDGETVKLTSLTWPEVLAGKKANITGKLPLSAVRLLAPLARPGKIVAIGLNYRDHCRETNTTPPEQPLVFTKFTSSLNHPGGEIVWSTELTQQVDYEAELAVVIGKTCKEVSEQEALSYVFGYTIANDVSARDLQLGDGQWVRGKSLDTFCPLGPVLVTAGEIPDPQALRIRCWLNDKLVQNSNTSEMIFPVARLVSFCSQAFTLEPGDVLLTGTPHGVGMSRQPQLFMKHGDRVAVEIEGLGRLENFCISA
jgi:2-keto-4-pentenoate hydratase/2-oxohepta-3-ene-1,7-dioic acid hydratase in catechol pathway